MSEVVANFDNTVDKIAVKFPFRKVEVVVDGKGTGEFTRRPTVELELPLLSVEGLVAALQAGGKQLDLAVEAVREVQLARARDIVNAREDINASNFPYEELAWEKIANLPKAERGGGISKETWEEFAKAYISIMPGVTGKTIEQVTNASKLMLNRFQAIKTNKPVLRLLKEQLAIFANSAPQAEQFSDCIQFLVEKADTFLNMDEATLLANL